MTFARLYKYNPSQDSGRHEFSCTKYCRDARHHGHHGGTGRSLRLKSKRDTSQREDTHGREKAADSFRPPEDKGLLTIENEALLYPTYHQWGTRCQEGMGAEGGQDGVSPARRRGSSEKR